MDHIRTKYSRSNVCTHTRLQRSCKALLSNLSLRSATQVFHCFLQRCRIAGRLAFSLCTSTYFLYLSKMVMVWQHILPLLCRRSGEARMETQRPWKRARTALTSFQIPYMHHKAFSTLLHFNDMEVNRTYTYQFYRPFTNVPTFCWKWTCMHKQLIPGHLFSSHVAWERG